MKDNVIDVIKKITATHTEDEYGKAIAEFNDYEIAMALSPIRSNCIEWLDIPKDSNVLEWGGNYGEITGMLTKKSSHVTCLELSMEKCNIINDRCKNSGSNLNIVSSIEELVSCSKRRKFDYVFLIGSLEKSSFYFTDKHPDKRVLSFLRTLLSDDGKIVIACSNRFGLKFWNGCVEENSRRLFEGIEGFNNFPEFNNYSMNGIKELSLSCGMQISQMRYVYPDYKNTILIFSDEFLPHRSALYFDDFQWEAGRESFFSEHRAYTSIIKENMFPIFVNSFIFVLENHHSKNIEKDEQSRRIFVKYSNLRSKKFQIRTDIIQYSNGKRVVQKKALSQSAMMHLKRIYKNYDRISSSYSKKNIQVNYCQDKGEYIEFEYLQGAAFSEFLYQLIEDKRYDDFVSEVVSFFKVLQMGDISTFHVTEEFVKVFGEVSFSKELKSACISNIDVNFDNVFLNNGVYQVIDYEWTFDFDIPMNYIIHGCLDIFFNHMQWLNDEDLIKSRKMIYSYLDVSEDEIIQYRNMWLSFNKYMMGECIPGMKDLQLNRGNH